MQSQPQNVAERSFVIFIPCVYYIITTYHTVIYILSLGEFYDLLWQFITVHFLHCLRQYRSLSANQGSVHQDNGAFHAISSLKKSASLALHQIQCSSMFCSLWQFSSSVYHRILHNSEHTPHFRPFHQHVLWLLTLIWHFAKNQSSWGKENQLRPQMLLS